MEEIWDWDVLFNAGIRNWDADNAFGNYLRDCRCFGDGHGIFGISKKTAEDERVLSA